MGGFKKAVKKVTKAVGEATGLQALGNGWWTDVREPLTYAGIAAGAVATGGAALGALGYAGFGLGAAGAAGAAATTTTGALISGATALSAFTYGAAALGGAYMGFSANQQAKALKAQEASDAATLAAADKQAQLAYNASLVATAAPATTTIDSSVSDSNESTLAKRRYSMSRTTISNSLLGGFGRQTLG